jgi:DNA (cytosine-5)-methyltransferase 1
MEKLRLLSLFAGIGGFELGLERSGGFHTVAQCEIDPYCNKVLAKHWPEVKRYGDIRELTAARLAADGIAVDAICGGFPCQDISNAGKGAGIEGERSGLWGEYARLIGELRPEVVFVENVAALLGRGLDRVLGDLAALGYDAWWDCIPASAVGAPHQRDRLWLVAYPSGTGLDFGKLHTRVRREAQQEERRKAAFVGGPAWGREVLADTIGGGRPGPGQSVHAGHPAPRGNGQTTEPVDGGFRPVWGAEPNVGRVAHGIPARAHRLRALGNAVVPQIPELLGRAYLQAMEAA